MKVLTLLASVIVTFSSCNCQKTAAEKATLADSSTEAKANSVQETTLPLIQYGAMTRNFHLSIEIKNDEIFVAKSNQPIKEIGPKIVVSKSDWNELVALYKAIDVKKVPSYRGPTQKRFYDGAPMASLAITIADVRYETEEGFDHGFPPTEIEQFVNKLVAIANKQQQ